MGLKKRGQVTIFIIIGILIVIIIGALFFISDRGFSRRTLSDAQVEPIRTYLRECVENIVREDLGMMRENGGYLFSSSLGKINVCDEGDYVILATRDGNEARRNLRVDLEPRVKSRINSECRIDSIFGDQFNIRQSNVDVDINFNLKSVDVSVDLNTIITKGIGSIDLGRILITIDDDISRVNELARVMSGKFVGGEDLVSGILNGVRGVNSGDLFLPDVLIDSRDVLGENCDFDINTGVFDRPSCNMDCSLGCCIIRNKFGEENGLEPFRFGLKE